MDIKLVRYFKKESTKNTLKKTGLYLRRYCVWFIVNFIMCLIPFFVMLVLANSKAIIFSSFLSYNFTLVVSSLYLLIGLTMNTKLSEIEVIHAFSLLWILIISTLFVLNPSSPSQEVAPWFAELFSVEHFFINTIIILVITIIISFFQVKKTINESIKEILSKQLIVTSEDIAKNVAQFKEELKNENKKA